MSWKMHCLISIRWHFSSSSQPPFCRAWWDAGSVFVCIWTATQYPCSYWVSAECKRIRSCYLDPDTCPWPTTVHWENSCRPLFVRIHLHLVKAGGLLLQGIALYCFDWAISVKTPICKVMSLWRQDHVHRNLSSTRTRLMAWFFLAMPGK